MCIEVRRMCSKLLAPYYCRGAKSEIHGIGLCFLPVISVKDAQILDLFSFPEKRDSVWERQRERERERERVCVCERERECVCVCVREWERERERERERKRVTNRYFLRQTYNTTLFFDLGDQNFLNVPFDGQIPALPAKFLDYDNVLSSVILSDQMSLKRVLFIAMHFLCSLDWGCKINWLLLCRGVILLTSVLDMTQRFW